MRRRARSLQARGDEPAESAPLYFLHIPKTAGVTVTMFLDAGFRADEICPATDWDTLLAIPPRDLARFKLFRGHFGAMLPAMLPRAPRVVTVLRDPVARAVSEWRYVLRHEDHPYHAQAMSQGPCFTTWVRTRPSSPQARNLGVDVLPADLVQRLRSNPSGDRYAAQDLLESEAWRVQQALPDADLVDRALRLLERCLVVGFADRLDDCAAMIADALGWAPPAPLPVRNATPEGAERFEPSDGEREAVLEHDAADVLLTETARARHGGVWSAARSEQARRAWERTLDGNRTRLRGEFVVDLLDAVPGRGWLPVMEGAVGCVRWMGPGLEATIDLPIGVGPGTRVELCCASAVDPNLLDAWSLEVNGVPVALDRRPSPEGTVCSGVVATPRRFRDRTTRLAIRVPYTVAYPLDGPMTDDALDLGVSFRWLRLVPS